MCGIAGFFDPRHRTPEPSQVLSAMGSCISHRGPDAGAEWMDRQSGIAFAHRRLAIIDLSVEGAQPMQSADARFVIVFNGEIYNFEELRQELEKGGAAPAWRGHSDTEVLLACICAWGIRETLQRCNGMFALALWDRQARQL